jgi:hypothetical protein
MMQMNPSMMGPGMTGPGMTGPGMIGPGMTGPGMQPQPFPMNQMGPQFQTTPRVAKRQVNTVSPPTNMQPTNLPQLGNPPPFSPLPPNQPPQFANQMMPNPNIFSTPFPGAPFAPFPGAGNQQMPFNPNNPFGMGYSNYSSDASVYDMYSSMYGPNQMQTADSLGISSKMPQDEVSSFLYHIEPHLKPYLAITS